jgi:aminoglycoside phosphotransferase (APT) family kinase protein
VFEGLQSIIDWELAHIGNPLQDLGWVCGNSWRFGKSDKVVGGFGELEDLLEGYNSISRLKVNKEMVKCWQVFGTFRWGVICLIQAYAHLNVPNTCQHLTISVLPKKPAEDQLEDLYATYQSFEQPSPVFEYAFLWLKEQDFSNFQESLVHGDFRLGNIIVNGEGLQSIIDWELAHIGNPLQDLGWVCGYSWRFGKSDKVVGGFGELEDLLEGYNSISRLKVNKEMVKCWQVFGTFRWGVICLIQAYAHLNVPNTCQHLTISVLPKKPAEDQLEDLYATYQSFEQPSPVFEYAFLWLKEQDFSNFQESLVHGDFRLGNIIVNGEGLQSIIDWELAHIGNPLQDLGWVC